MTIDPELGEESPRQIDHLLGSGNNTGLPFEPSTPVALSAMIPLNASRARLAHHRLALRQNGGLGAPLIGVVNGHPPVDKAVYHLR